MVSPGSKIKTGHPERGWVCGTGWKGVGVRVLIECFEYVPRTVNHDVISAKIGPLTEHMHNTDE